MPMPDAIYSVAADVPVAVAGVILAGGQSRRMGGVDKALLTLAGRSLLVHVVERLAPQVAQLAVNANHEHAEVHALGLTVIPDAGTERSGPLAGILAGMDWAASVARAKSVVTVPVDTPFIPANLVQALAAGARDGETIGVARSHGALHPVVALFPVGLRDDLSAWLATTEDRAVRTWLARHRIVAVDFPDASGADPFFNVNTPDDLKRAERLIAHAG